MTPNSKASAFYGTWKFYCCVHKSSPLVPIMIHIKQSTALKYLLNTHFNIILPFTLGSSEWPLALRRPYKTRYVLLPHVMLLSFMILSPYNVL